MEPVPTFACPLLYHLIRPYQKAFEKGGILTDDDDGHLAVTSSEYFADGLHVTQQTKNDVSEPIGGYWSCPNFVGNRNWIWQWVMAPKQMNRYSYAD